MMKRRGWLIVLMVLCVCIMTNAQQLSQQFPQFKARIDVENQQRIQRIENFINQNNGEREIPAGNGVMAYIYDVINGKPIYVASDNLASAGNVGVSELRLGGGLGLNLTGKGLRLLVWDEPGGARPTHVEFEDRLTPGSDFAPGGAVTHATHVTGTVMAAGINPNARGMAYEAAGVVYNFNNDVSEMTSELADNAETMILSNHSYGPLAGWRFNNGNWSWDGDPDISAVEDWKFGFYGNRARQYDDLVFNAPYYLIIKSAGNHRTDVGDDSTIPGDGPYDIIGLQGTAKNIVTVGAVLKLGNDYSGPDDVQISSFSSFGPTDDGRIKPDISAPGVAVFSTGSTADDTYATLQGTSMATPVVLGSLALIQQLNQELNGGFMKAAALKGLMIHHAREAGGGDGPDYEHGWGLLNAEAMAKFLLEENNDNNDLIMDQIADGETKSYTINPVQGTKVTLTLVWTDVPGTPVATQLDPENLMLVNDLDMRAEGATETQEPWILRPEVPTQPAQKGDNFRDNVEKIEFQAVDGSYTVNITHKGSISQGPQEYALVIEYEKESAAKTMYWVGNSGNWSDGANWSLSSGGQAADMVPASQDIVIFDNNSFSGLGEQEAFTISLAQNVEVAQFRWLANKEGTVDFGGNTLTTDGDLVVLSDLVNLNNGFINMSGDNGDAILNVRTPVSGSDIVIDSPGSASFQLVGNISASSLKLLNGTLNISGNALTLDEFIVTGGELNVTDANFSISTAFTIEDETPTVSWSGSELMVPANGNATIDLSGSSIPIDLNVAGTATFTSGSGINRLTLGQNITINADLIVEDIALAAGSTVSLGDGNTLTVNNTFDPSGTDGSLVSFTSAGTGELAIAEHRKVCVDFINVSGVNYTGQATLAIGTNSTLAGSEQGWKQQACDDVLFADFSFTYGCVNGLTMFENRSSGDVQSSSWNFGESTPGTVDSEETNPSYSYSTAGPVDIVLTVTDPSSAFELTVRTEIIDNTIGSFEVIEQVGFLVSNRAGDSYQWYKDGVAIEGEITRQLAATEEGTYKVLVFDDPCNRFSADFELRVTGIDVDPVEKRKVEQALNVFPNPTRDHLDITIEGYDLRSVAIELVDPSGKVVTTATHERVNSQSFSSRIDVADKRQGFYILRFLVNESVYVNRKVILTD